MYSKEWHECIVLEDQIDAKHARNMQRKVALLDTDPDDSGLIARPMIEIEYEREKIHVPFDVLAYFDTFEEAEEYVDKNNLTVSIIPEE
ncbi:MAG: hypothetical protein KGD59_06080 [Candidatus Heimdallarchaeota archaeon]|nr:hypothetical protein [Candidatus Heimdallarchaeota archaeon]MBY8994100.1 hypothetical protein [Candidatus Heimdallarchaeota archaeon]